MHRKLRSKRLWKRGLTILVWALLTSAVALSLIAVIRKIPEWQQVLSSPEMKPDRRVELENDIYKNFAQILGGVFILIGFYLTWRNVHVANEGQITTRFTKAVEQLGVDS